MPKASYIYLSQQHQQHQQHQQQTNSLECIQRLSSNDINATLCESKLAMYDIINICYLTTNKFEIYINLFSYNIYIMVKRKSKAAIKDDCEPMDIDWEASTGYYPPASPLITKKARKTYIPKAVKMVTWANAFGLSTGQTKCPICKFNIISQMDFHCAHIIAEAKGGATRADNLLPTCSKCNLSMGKENLIKFRNKYFD
jgi:5-methylcytosine-specific restriction endonuclease McrA